MGSTRCRHFVQNAWKKDLCSNCFKGRDEHAAPVRLVPRAVVPAAPPPQGILKGQKWTRSKTHRVYFPAEECEVIGEGGEDAGPPSDDDSDGQDDADWGKPVPEDDPQEQEQARLLQALTRSNTDFNSIAANLEGSAPSPPAAAKASAKSSAATAGKPRSSPQSSLQLGRPQTDAEGRKQTLLVSVQPFGKPAASTPPSTTTAAAAAAAQPEHVTKIPVATPPSAASCNGVVLKSIVHTGEDAPTPTPATKVPSSDAPPAAALNPAPTPTPAPAPALTPAPTLLKLDDAQTGKHAAVATPPPAPAPLSSKHMFLKSFVEPAEAPAVCISSTAIHDSLTKTAASSPSPASPVRVSQASQASPVKSVPASPVMAAPTAKTTPASPAKTSPTKTAPASSTKTSGVVKATAVMTTTTTVTSSGTARREGKRTHITRGTPISKNNEMLLKTKFIPLRTSTILNNNNNNNKRNSEDAKHRSDPVMLIEAKQLDSSDEDDRPYSNVQVQSLQSLQSHKSVDDAPGAQTKRLASLLAPLGVVGVVGSREMAGEPDGRADPDSSSESGSEPPALPQSPPPAVDPRPSFLHGLTARLAANNNAVAVTSSTTTSLTTSVVSPASEKPRVPFKSSTVVQAATAQQLHQQRWSQVISTQAKTVTAVEPPQAPSCSPPCTPNDTPVSSPSTSAPSSASSSPPCSPHGTPPADSSGRQKRQAPQPPQEQPSSPAVLYAAAAATVSSSPASPPKDAANAPPMRPALGRSASTASSTSSSSSPSASPPSPVLIYHRKASAPAASPVSPVSPVSRPKEKEKRRSSQHLLVAPLPPLAPTRSESVPSALGQVGLGHSVTLGAHSGHSIAQALAQANSFVSRVSMSPHAGQAAQGQPQPSPRRALSMSSDSLSGGSPSKHPTMYDTERKKPGTKVRFSLRKFLGLSKEGGNLRGDAGHGPGAGFADGHGLASLGSPGDPLAPPQPRPRPRLEIIHPSDLSGRGVEVLRASGVEVRRQMQEQAAQAQAAQAAAAAMPPRRNSDAASVVDGAADYAGDNGGKGRPSKPPPPPRSQSLENDATLGASPSRPSRPPPPKSAHVDLLMRRHSPTAAASPTPGPAPGHSVYANIAPASEALARSSVAPTKPQRTGSVRDATADSPRRSSTATPATATTATTATPGAADPVHPVKQEAATRSCSLSSQPEDSGYESVELSDSAQPQSMTDSENVYECVNSTGGRTSSPECDSKGSGLAAGEGGVGVGVGVVVGVVVGGAGTTLRAGAERPASSSTHYCGSETESDIYSPYSFYGGSEEGDDGEADSSWRWRSRARKGRSVVHKSMEDNYDAVVGANLEALAQLFEQIRTGPTIPTALRPLKTSTALNWCDFSLTPSPSQPAPAVVAGRWVFLSALWDGHPVTVGVLPDGSVGCAKAWRGGGRGAFPFALMPITEFYDRVPASCLPPAAARAVGHVEALVAVLARARVDTLTTYGTWLRSGGSTATGTTASSAEADEAREEDAAWREAGLALLQLLNALLALQALRQDQVVQADSVVFLRDPGQALQAEHHDATPQLALLHGMGTAAASDADVARSLCACALAGVRALLPRAPPSPLLCSLLEDKASEMEPSAASEAQQGGLSLARAKAVLEYWLWGPAEAVSSLDALQRWLDLERATVLHRLVCARAAAGPHHRLAIQQQSHLLFLVHTSAATMCDASRLLETAHVSPLETAS